MELTLYENLSDKNVLSKTLQNPAGFSGNLRESSDVVNPEITLSIENPTSYNYVYIPLFSRYYYITEMQSVRTGIWKLSLHCDVLMSFKTQIEKCSGTVNDGTETGSRYLAGSQWRATQKNKTDIIQFPSGLLETGQYILITSGG